MPRKSYSIEERQRVKETLMTTVLQCIIDRGLIHSSIDVLCRKVGISKTFFYTFFSSKEELVIQALRYQQPKLIYNAFQQEQIVFYSKLLSVFGLPVNSIDPRLFGNMALSMMMVYKSIPDTMPFLFSEVAEDMVEFQVNALIDEMERVKEKTR